MSGLRVTCAFVSDTGSCWMIQSGEPIAIGEMSTFLPDSHVPVSTTR